MEKQEFIAGYVTARAGASVPITASKLIASANAVWNEMQWASGAEAMPEAIANAKVKEIASARAGGRSLPYTAYVDLEGNTRVPDYIIGAASGEAVDSLTEADSSVAERLAAEEAARALLERSEREAEQETELQAL